MVKRTILFVFLEIPQKKKAHCNLWNETKWKSVICKNGNILMICWIEISNYRFICNLQHENIQMICKTEICNLQKKENYSETEENKRAWVSYIFLVNMIFHLETCCDTFHVHFWSGKCYVMPLNYWSTTYIDYTLCV